PARALHGTVRQGFSDEFLDKAYNEFKDKVLCAKPNYCLVSPALVPDVWIAPEVVWEVQGADLSVSPVHMAAVGKVDPNKGISIRFPRLLRERSPDDKDPSQATTADEIVHFYKSQDVIKNNAGNGNDGGNSDDDFL
ncbi:unnamed protein product, partial [Phaeothamnion confervicola]